MRRLALFLILLTPAASCAQAKVRGETTYKPFEPIVLKADGGSAKAQYLWDVSSTTGSVQIVESGAVCYVWASPGQYEVRLTAIDFKTEKVERARFSFAVLGDVPTPPDPKPPGPGPPPPTPTDPLFAPLQAAFAADSGRAAQAVQLAALYREFAATTIQKPQYVTLVDALAVLKAAADSLIPPPALAKTKRVVADELNAKLPRSPQSKLDAPTRALVAVQFNRVAALLEALK